MTAAVRAIRVADFRGERGDLRRLAADIDQVKARELLAYRDYWRGFALWRSALNGFNETPTPADLQADLEGATQAFRAALKIRPDWIEPKVALAFKLGLELRVPRAGPPRGAAPRGGAPWASTKGPGPSEHNPRLADRRAATLPARRRGRGGRHLPARPAGRPGRGPSQRPGLDAGISTAWGAAEHLMSLAYAHSKGALAERETAQAYADGALALAPDWHYVRDILVPQIQALPPRGQ